jgi:hypothetical protein
LKHFNCAGASSPPDPWLTREVLYIAPSGFDPSVERQNTTRCTQSFPSHGLRAQDCGRVGASETFVGVGVHLLSEDRRSRFWGVSSTRLLATVQSSSCTVRDWSAAVLEGAKIGTASSGTTTPTSAMSTSAGLNAAGYNLFQLLTVLHIIYISAYYARSNFVMNFASGMFLLLIWLNFEHTRPSKDNKNLSLVFCLFFICEGIQDSKFVMSDPKIIASIM